MASRRKVIGGVGCLFLLIGLVGPVSAEYWPVGPSSVVDLSSLVSMRHYQNWPGGNVMNQFVIVPYRNVGPGGPYNSDLILLDENTATQMDCPPHMMPPLETGLPNAGYWGSFTCDKVPIWQFLGEVVKVDARSILDQAPNGVSPLITVDMIKAAERAYRELRPGDALLFWSGYDDKYDKPLPEGRRLLIAPIEGSAPAWPDPDFDATDYAGSKGVRLMGTDSPSLGAFGPPKYAQPGPQGIFTNPLPLESHLGNFKRGGIHTEGLTNLDKVPNGSLYISLPVKHYKAPTVEARAAAITDLRLAAELLKAVRAHRVVDLSVLNREDLPVWWPGAGVGNFLWPYQSLDQNWFTGPAGPFWTRTHIMDAHTGTHFDPPAHFGPPPGFDFNSYDDWTKGVLRKFEARYGKLKTTDVTGDKVPLWQLMGPARVVDVQHRLGTTDPKSWPASPPITVEDVQAHERLYGPIQAGEVVIFRTNHNDAHFRPITRDGDEAVKKPLDGQAEGWPAPTPETILYLARKGVKTLAIDAPSMGSVRGEEAVMTHWAAVNEGMNFVEFLIGVGQIPPKGAFFVFLPVKIEGVRGGPGRAIAILP